MSPDTAGFTIRPALWLAACQIDNNADPRPNLYNCMLALRDDQELVNVFAYDEMLRAAVLQRPVPGTIGNGSFEPRPVTDCDVTALQEFLQAAGLEKLGKDVVHQAVELRAQERSFHPVRDYLNALEWDGRPRLPNWLTVYMGAEASEYHNNVGCMFLIQMVARIYKPGCQADYMMVLEGLQGELKSSACRVLAGKDEWFSDSLPNLQTSDRIRVSHHLRGKWLIEVAEMSAMSKAETIDLKAFITQRVEQFTPKYGRKESYEPRQCVFVGTTNKEAYLRDETGSRRFWPVKTRHIDLRVLVRDRDQLFAEAVEYYREGRQWWPDRDFERQYIQPQQESRYEADAWEGVITEYLACRTSVTLLDVAQDALHIETSRLSRADQLRIGNAMRRAHWTEGKRTKTSRLWVPEPKG
jgi:predicted P-loop ATPase